MHQAIEVEYETIIYVCTAETVNLYSVIAQCTTEQLTVALNVLFSDFHPFIEWIDEDHSYVIPIFIRKELRDKVYNRLTL